MGDISGQPEKTKKLIIFGTEDFADIAFEYFTWDSEYEVVGFCVDHDYKQADQKLGLPIFAFDEIEENRSADEVEVYVAVVYGRMNRTRDEICTRFVQKGYRLASYISSRAFVWRNVTLGEHCFIFEDNTIQPFVRIGDNVVLWSGNHIGHHSHIESHCFISSHVVVSGWVEIGDHCFIGVNTSIANNSKIGAGSWINHGANVSGTVPAGSLIRADASDIKPLNEAALFRSMARASNSRSRES